ncbi:MAG: ATP-grasp domain-containing protein [Actinobacteria bacterium]|nr:ATP-grasp domain-containing protein [Actinomycetota bacterium]
MTVVLFTCAGQRVDIVTAFARAGATTIATDADRLAPSLYYADQRALVPRVDHPGYIDALRELVELHDVRLIVPLTDLDHLQLAVARDDLGDAVVLVPSADTIAKCSDKYLAHQFFDANGIGSPPTWLPGELSDLRYPVLVKARKGFGSRHIYRAENAADLEFFLAHTSAESMIQALCAGVEFSIDVFCDLDSRCLAAIPRTMIESKGGESIKGMTIKDPDLIAFACKVAEALEIIGPANVQCFREPDGQLQVTDVNPRFGGGFPLPTAAGSRYPELALAIANGERPEPRFGEFREGVVMTRFFSHVILEERDGTLEPVREQPEAVPEQA